MSAEAPPDTFAYRRRDANPVVRALLAHLGAGEVDPAVHAGDEMLAYAVHSRRGDRDAALVDYFRLGWEIAGRWRRLLAWRFGEPRAAGRILDFAGGYGRATRFLVRHLPPERIWVAEIEPRALAFQRRRFGVHPVPSAADPREFTPAGRFDAVFVASLFTHLPAERFTAWLERLTGLLAPGGVLAFSLHDRRLAPLGHRRGRARLHFEAESESATLDPSEYGASWADEAFVGETLRRLAPRLAWRRYPKGLSDVQDLYVAADGAQADFSTLRLGPAPEGLVEGYETDPEGRLSARGWAVDPASGAPAAEVRLFLDGELLAATAPAAERPDVAERYGAPSLLRSGWRLEGTLPAELSPATDVLVVEAGGRDASAILDVQPAGQAGAASLRRQNDLLREKIAAMEASRFWKLRNAWMALKRKLPRAGR